MGLIRRVLASVGAVDAPKPAAPVEWQGEVIEAALGAGHQADRLRRAEGKRRRNVWAVLEPGRTANGRPKVDVLELLVGGSRGIRAGAKLGQASAREGGKLDGAIQAGVRVGVVQLSADVVDTKGRGVEYSAVLIVGRGYRYRPRAAWD